jgi:hypothetical protein
MIEPVANVVTADLAPDRPSGNGQIAQQVEDLVTYCFVWEPQLFFGKDP